MSSSAKKKPAKLKPIDYGAMFGGPILFVAAIAIGISRALPRGHPPGAVAKLHSGVVVEGNSEQEAIDRLGEPKSKESSPTGGEVYHYERSVYRQATHDLALEDAAVEFSPDHIVESIKYDVHPFDAATPAK